MRGSAFGNMGKVRKGRAIFCSGLFVFSALLLSASLAFSATNHLVISEVCVGQGSSNEFVELYNPTTNSITISDTNFKLKLVSDNNTVSQKNITWVNQIVPAKGFFLFAGGTINKLRDASYAGQLEGTAGIILTDQNDVVIDKVAWGSPPPSNGVETTGIASVLGANDSIERKALATSTTSSMLPGGADHLQGNGEDTDNNASDFVVHLGTFNPQNSQEALEPRPSAVINEVAWMGTTADANDEWIELVNTGNSAVSLSGWTLKAADGTPNITLSGSIPANGFYLLERTDDNTISNITADKIYTGALSNTGEDLLLIDSSSNTVDRLNFASAWPAGDNTAKKTMERKLPTASGSLSSNWGTNDGVTITGLDSASNPIKGTPKLKNSVFDEGSPSTITDLKAMSGVGSGQVNLTWTSPGDDGASGTASSYIVKYATFSITISNFDQTSTFIQSWSPKISGSKELHTVSGLTASTAYFFSVKSKDDVSNLSDVSNSPQATAQSSDAFLINEVAPSESGGADIIEFYVSKPAHLGGIRVYDNSNAQGAETAKTFPTTGDWANPIASGTFVVLRFNNTSSDETTVGSDKLINIFTTDSGLTATDNVIFLGDIEGIAFSAGSYQSGTIADFLAYADQNTTELVAKYQNAINSATLQGQWSKISSTPLQFDCPNSRGLTGGGKGLARDNVSTDADNKSDWSYRTSLTIGFSNGGHTTAQGIGTGAIAPSAAVVKSSTGTWALTYQAANPNSDNVSHMLTLDISSGWTAPQTSNSANPGFVSSTFSFPADYGLSVIASKVVVPVGNMNNGGNILIEYKNATTQSSTGTAQFTISSDEVGTNVGALSAGSPSLLVTDDGTAPATITNLSATTGTQEGSVNLSWTAPGDDGTAGTATKYIIRFSSTTGVIDTDAKFNAAQNVSNPPAPLSGGSNQAFTLTGLFPASAYHFAMKTEDEVPNTSGLSNSPSTAAANTPPQPPQGVSATAGPSRVDLSWFSNTEPDILGYNAYRSTTLEGAFSKINTSTITATSFQDTNVTPGTTYYYKITALDRTNLESGFSSVVSAVPLNLVSPVGRIVVNEIMYDPSGTEPDLEWIEIHNKSGDAVDLSSVTVSDGEGTFTIPNGRFMVAGAFFVLGNTNGAANGLVDLVYGTNTVGSLTLTNTGDDVILKDASSVHIDSVAFLSSWGANNGSGPNNFTLERKSPTNDPALMASWGHSQTQGGTPKAANSVETVAPSITHTPITQAIAQRDIGIHATIIDNIDVLPPGNAKFFYRTSGPETPGPYVEVIMSRTADTKFDGIIPGSSVTTAGIDYYIEARDTSNNFAFHGTPGSPNHVNVVTSALKVVVNEIMYDPKGSEPALEWVELHNYDTSSVDISSWVFTDGEDSFTIPGGKTIPAGGFFVLGYSSSAAGGNVDVVYGGSAPGIQLTNPLALITDQAIIKDSTGLVIDEVNYASGWGAMNTQGPNDHTLERISTNTALSNSQSNWLFSYAQTGTPQAKNTSKLIRNVSLTPSLFDPNKGETSQISYGIFSVPEATGTTTNVTVEIRDSSNTLRKTFTTMTSSTGTFSHIWDGKDESGVIVLGINRVKTTGTNGGATSTVDSNDKSLLGFNDRFDKTKLFAGANEVVTAFYFLDKPVLMNIDIKVKDTTIQIRTLHKDIPRGAGDTTTVWDGKDDAGLFDLRATSWKFNATDIFGINLITQSNLAISKIKWTPRSAFNPTASQTEEISFHITRTATVTVKIKDKSGVLVKTLADNQSMSQGINAVIWDGKNTSGQIVSDGRYNFSIEATAEGQSVMKAGQVQVSSLFP